MTRISNDPADFADEALAGFCDAHAPLVRQVDGGAVRRARPAAPKVAVLLGGGSGHYPAFAGLVGAGFADGAVVGNIFTSPSAQQAVAVARAAHSGAGVVFAYGNYAGDVMNFGVATERLRDDGIETENVIVTDDIASAPPGEREGRRGIAGDFTVFKVLGAAAEEGADLAEVVRLGRKANDFTRTMGTAFAGCTFPGAEKPLFSLPEGMMGLGLGIHGEPGLKDLPLPRAEELGRNLVERVLEERPDGAGDRVAVILNGLGSTKAEELFVLWRTIGPLLRDHGLELVAPEVGELVTSLDMAGVSLTLMWLDDELARLWLAPTETPAFRRGRMDAANASPGTTGSRTATESTPAASANPAPAPAAPAPAAPAPAAPAPAEPAPVAPAPASVASRDYARSCLQALAEAQRTLHRLEPELAALDSIAGDGDHGRGMVRGVDAAVTAAREAADAGAGAGSVLAAGGDAWADKAGGTSGVLWGAGLRAWGQRLGDEDAPDDAAAAAAVASFAERIVALGGAQPGDKTLVDALAPFVAELTAGVDRGTRLPEAWEAASAAAEAAARATAGLRPQKGRARPLAEKSLGTPDPGAVSLAAVFAAMGPAFADARSRFAPTGSVIR
ncbi:dihydroxyacetone kinase family protein [Sinomonas terrae]|uniref:Dihydroxyacetone kinase family protein n=1 Tax=Sinomonas terrae TaxID=2908838 RepID=A0ABS9U292_9MICC|nr:dihydroxyacetone kinase family protein [Sinomonas terrae]MCH6470809.1 dihydroxyacetone kinase family protein [Sinomonas terrae]